MRCRQSCGVAVSVHVAPHRTPNVVLDQPQGPQSSARSALRTIVCDQLTVNRRSCRNGSRCCRQRCVTSGADQRRRACPADRWLAAMFRRGWPVLGALIASIGVRLPAYISAAADHLRRRSFHCAVCGLRRAGVPFRHDSCHAAASVSGLLLRLAHGRCCLCTQRQLRLRTVCSAQLEVIVAAIRPGYEQLPLASDAGSAWCQPPSHVPKRANTTALLH